MNNYKNKIIGFFYEVGNLMNFTLLVLRNSLRRPFEREEFLRQSFNMGVKSLPLISITAVIMGIVLTLQTRPVLAKLGAEIWLPGMVFVSFVREIGPVITALIFAGKVGSGIGAELSSMRVTEQIDAMEVSGTNPLKYLVSTRVFAATFIVPLLVIYSDFIALAGSYIGMNIQGNISLRLFFILAFESMHFYDIVPALIKTFFFGFGIGIISCYKGYYMNEGTQGVGKASNVAVVLSSLSIFIIDLIVVQITEVVL
jgi:phospholipid/cholesterol/gamma-HCH transport system permease protein